MGGVTRGNMSGKWPDIADGVVHHEGSDQGVGIGRSGAAL